MSAADRGQPGQRCSEVIGIGRQYSELLLAEGVDSTPKLVAIKPQELVRLYG